MNKRKVLLVLLLAISLVLSGCGMKADEPINYGDEYGQDDTTPDPPAAVVDDAVLDGGDVVQTAALPALLDRKIIYTAGLSISSPTPEVIYNEVVADLDTYTAYIESANITANRYVVKIRVLSVNFTDFIEDIKADGEVVSYTKTSEDVTNSYSTFEARKLALETQHARILELIAEAVDLSVILTLEDARFEIETELNEIGDALANFDSLVDFSTINLTINKTTDAVIILPLTSTPGVIVSNTTKNTTKIIVTNNDDLPALLYIDVYQNGEFLREYDGEAFPNGSATFEIAELDSNTDYTFKVTAISADQRESTSSQRSIHTESTFFNKVGNVFVTSFETLVVIFEFLGLALVAIAPFALTFVILFIPSRILYRKYGKEYFKKLKERRSNLNSENREFYRQREIERNEQREAEKQHQREQQNKQRDNK